MYVTPFSDKQRVKGKSHASLGYYPLLILLVGGEEISTHNPSVIERDFKTVGWLVRESEAQVIFSFLLPVAGSDTESNRWIINIVNTLQLVSPS